jgi:hypothetical protein
MIDRCRRNDGDPRRQLGAGRRGDATSGAHGRINDRPTRRPVGDAVFSAGVTEVPSRPIPMAVDAVRAWLRGPDLTPVLAHVEEVFDRGGAEGVARLAVGLTVLAGWLTTRIEREDGVAPNDLLDEVARLFDSPGVS